MYLHIDLGNQVQIENFWTFPSPFSECDRGASPFSSPARRRLHRKGPVDTWMETLTCTPLSLHVPSNGAPGLLLGPVVVTAVGHSMLKRTYLGQGPPQTLEGTLGSQEQEAWSRRKLRLQVGMSSVGVVHLEGG